MSNETTTAAVIVEPRAANLATRESAPAQGDSSALMRMIESAMSKPDFDVDKLVKLIEVKERWEANEARIAFNDAMARFKEDAPKILKDKHVKYGTTEYDHASIGNVVEQIVGGLAAQGISHSWKTEQVDAGMVTVTCVLTHRLGHSESNKLKAAPDTSGAKNTIQAMASTVSYLERYTLLAITGLATSDMDDDGRGGQQPPAKGQGRAADVAPARIYSQEEMDALRKKIKATTSLDELGDVWKAMPKDDRAVMTAAKDAQKERLTAPVEPAQAAA